jgi:accessory gene regulator protein AgrB
MIGTAPAVPLGCPGKDPAADTHYNHDMRDAAACRRWLSPIASVPCLVAGLAAFVLVECVLGFVTFHAPFRSGYTIVGAVLMLMFAGWTGAYVVEAIQTRGTRRMMEASFMLLVIGITEVIVLVGLFALTSQIF